MCRSNSLPVIQAGGGSYVFHTSPKQDTALPYQDTVETVTDRVHGPKLMHMLRLYTAFQLENASLVAPRLTSPAG